MPHETATVRAAEAELSTTALCELYIAQHHRFKRVVDEAMQEAGLSLARAKVLDRLHAHGPVRQQALAESFGFAPRSITDMVDSLERDGLAERLDDPGDRRAKLVRITAAGQSAVAVALVVRNELIKQTFGALPADDRAELARLLFALDDLLASIPDKERHVFNG